MRAANGTGANRATAARVRNAVVALGATDARHLADVLAQAQADLDEAYEHLEGIGAGTIGEGLLGAFVKSQKTLDKFILAVNAGADEAENQDAHFRSALGDA
jgi:hypothetical protein